MCWCFKVFFRIFGNLAGRIFTDCLDATYKMCWACFCRKHRNSNVAANTLYEERKFELNEPFCLDVNRETSEILLDGKRSGTFIIRPAFDRGCVGILSVIQDNKIFHLVIRQREDSLIALGREKLNEKSFKDLDSLINYYVSNYLILFADGAKTYTLLFPYLQ